MNIFLLFLNLNVTSFENAELINQKQCSLYTFKVILNNIYRKYNLIEYKIAKLCTYRFVIYTFKISFLNFN